jgi:hypothetical protein
MKTDDKAWAAPVLLALTLLAASYLALFAVCRYRVGLPFPAGLDLLVVALPHRDWTWVLSQGYVIFLTGFFVFWFWRDRRRLAFILAATAVLMIVRDVFVLLTPVGPLPGLIPLYTGVAVTGIRDRLAFDGELFFSGHTAAPFLYCLLSRRERAVSLICLGVSLMNGLGVLLTRNHYSIDVLGAFVIVPTVVQLSRHFFGWMDPEPQVAA